MTAKTVGFAIAEEDGPMLQSLVEHFGHGNRSELLRIAMERLSRDMRAEKFQRLQQAAKVDLDGRVVTRQEILELLRER